MSNSMLLFLAAIFLAAMLLAIFLAGWRSLSARRRRAARRNVRYILPEWRGFDRPESPWETLTCDRLNEERLPEIKCGDVMLPETLRHAPAVRLTKEDFRPTAKEPAHPNIF